MCSRERQQATTLRPTRFSGGVVSIGVSFGGLVQSILSERSPVGAQEPIGELSKKGALASLEKPIRD